ncbi:hypothetical protein [Pseudomonas chlororaphis]|uniref:hypothetical protein n=1 Tax=Pseudomonas chlororaphis TaxID=587753 RepID=UPI0011D09E8B|nr:hypothetical protein [Pseudomonas chlororaphis]
MPGRPSIDPWVTGLQNMQPVGGTVGVIPTTLSLLKPNSGIAGDNSLVAPLIYPISISFSSFMSSLTVLGDVWIECDATAFDANNCVKNIHEEIRKD